MADNILSLKINVSNIGVKPKLNEITQSVRAMVKEITEQFNVLDNSFVASSGRMERATGTARTQITNLGNAAVTARNKIISLAEVMDALGNEFKIFKNVSSGTVTGLGKVATGAELAADALKGTAGSADTAATSLKGAADGAKAASGAISGLSRSSGNASLKIDALNVSTSKFDTAPVVAGADAAVASLDRMATAGAAAKKATTGRLGFVGGARTGGGGGSSNTRAGIMGAAASGILRGGGLVAEIVTALGLGSAAYSTQFDKSAQVVMGNTTMTKAEMAEMKRSVLAMMRAGSPIPEKELFSGYMHASNFGYSGKRGDMVMQIAEAMGVGTDAPVGVQAQVLAGSAAPTAFNIPDKKLKNFGEMLHVASAGSDLVLEEFSKSSTKSEGAAISAHINPAQWAAAYSTIVKSRVKPAYADTYLQGMINGLMKPTSQTVKNVERISDRTGVDLMQYLGVKGFEKHQISGLVDALHSPGITEQDVVDMLPATRGGQGLQRLYRNRGVLHSKLYGPQGTETAYAGGVHNIDKLRQDMMDQPGVAGRSELQKTKASAFDNGKSLQKDLTDIIHLLGEAAREALKVAGEFAKLPVSIRKLVETVGLIGIAGRITGVGLPGAEKLVGLRNFIKGGLPGLGAAGAAEGGALAGGAGLAEMVPQIALVTAAVVGLGVAWKTNYGSIRQSFAPFLADVKQTFGGMTSGIGDFVKTTLPDLKKLAKELEPLFKVAFEGLAYIVKRTFDIIKGGLQLVLGTIGGVVKFWLSVVTGDWKGAWGALKGIASNAIDAVLTMLNGVIPGFKKWISDIAADIKQGFINAMDGLKASFADGGKGMATDFIKGVKTALGIASPSKVMHQIGLNTGQGLTDGIRASTGGVVGAARDQAAAVIAEYKKELLSKHVHEMRRTGYSEEAIAGYVAAHGPAGDIISKRAVLSAQVGADRSQGDTVGALRARMNSALLPPGLTSSEREKIKASYQTQIEAAEGKQQAGKMIRGLNGSANLDDHYKTKFNAGIADGDSYLKYLTARQDALAKFGDANADFLAKQVDSAKRLQTIEQGIADQIDRVNGKLAHAADVRQKIADDIDAALADNDGTKFGRAKSANDSQLIDRLTTLLGHAPSAAELAKLKGSVGSTDGALGQIQSGIAPKGMSMDVFKALTLWQQNAGNIGSAKSTYDSTQADKGIDSKLQTAMRTRDMDLSFYRLATSDAQTYYQKRLDDLKASGKDQTDEYYAIQDKIAQIVDTGQNVIESIQQKAFARAEKDWNAHLTHTKQEVDAYRALIASMAAGVDPNSELYGSMNDAWAHAQVLKKAAGPGDISKDALAQDFASNLTEGFSSASDNLIHALLNPKKGKEAFKQFWRDITQGTEESVINDVSKNILKPLLTRAVYGMLGMQLPGGDSGAGFGGAVANAKMMNGMPQLGTLAGAIMGGGLGGHAMGPGAQSTSSTLTNLLMGGGGGLSTPGIAPGAGSAGASGILSQASGMSGILGMFGKQGLMKGLLGSGALKGLTAAMPWIGGGLLLNDILGNPFKKLFKKFHLFADGGFVPGHGVGDSVHAMLTPGEYVLPRSAVAAIRGGAGGHGGNDVDMTMNNHYYGDLHRDVDLKSVSRQQGLDWEQAVRAGIPG